MAKVLQIASTGGGSLTVDFGSNYSAAWIEGDFALDAVARADILTGGGFGLPFSVDLIEVDSHTAAQWAGAELYADTGPVAKWAAYNDGGGDPASTPLTPSPAISSLQFYRFKLHVVAGSPITHTVQLDGADIGTINVSGSSMADIRSLTLFQTGLIDAGFLYWDTIKVGTTEGASDIFLETFESGNLSQWTTVDAGFSVITDPGITPAGTTPPSGEVGRVLIAFNDGPLEPSPIWTAIDQATNGFPASFVSGYDITSGRQSLISQTDTGTATVYVNDRDGLFDPNNASSPYFGLLDGRQILLQLYDPVRAVWEEQFRGLIDDFTFDIDGSAVNGAGEPINANIQIECVDVFDYLAGYGLTPGLDGVTPPAGGEDTIYYAATAGSVQDRFLEVLADVGIDPTMYVVASGNTKVLEGRYDVDEAALTVLRDCADAELPFIANIYVNRHGQFCFRGRYSRFDPDGVAAEPGSDWDFNRWAVGDGPAIVADPTRAQMRILAYSRARSNIINAAFAYPQGLAAADMPGQVYADVTSIAAYGKHTPPGPMSDLLTADYAGPGTITPSTGTKQCALFAELLVKNQKDPRETITALQVKSINLHDGRGATTWALLSQADISDIINVAAGYPGGTGFAGASPADDYYIEGRQMRVRPANTVYDYVEADYEVSAAVWSMDTHSVFPAFGS